MADSTLTTQWAVCGIAAAAARFVPVPLLDDVIRQGAARLAVTRTVRARDAAVGAQVLEPLWSQDGGRGKRGLARYARALGRRLLLFPVRKYTALFGAVRGVPTDVLRVVLLARSTDRALEQGRLQQREDAQALRAAVDAAFQSVDLRLLVAAVSDTLSQTRGLSTAAVALARRRFGSGDDASPVAPEGPVGEGARKVSDVLARPETAVLLARFDAQVDARLQTAG